MAEDDPKISVESEKELNQTKVEIVHLAVKEFLSEVSTDHEERAA